MQKYTILDTEMRFDPYLQEAYQEIDPANARTRIGARRLEVIAMLDIDLDEEGRISVGPLASWTAEQTGEGPMLNKALFHLRERPDRKLVTYGGSAVDAKVIELAAMGHDLALPKQLCEQFGPRRDALHLDLAMAIKGFGRTWHHLSEIMLRVGVPVALIRNKAEPVDANQPMNWKSVREHCELDTLLTAIALMAWRRIQGDSCLHVRHAAYALVEGYLRQKPGVACVPLLRRQAAYLANAISSDLEHAT
jgi:hypothetical protein